MAALPRLASLALVGALCASTATAQCPADDAFEPNDSCARAARLTDGFYPSLTIRTDDPDYYTVVLGPTSPLTIDARFVHAFGDIDVTTYATTPACVAGAGSHWLRSVSTTDDENLALPASSHTLVTIEVKLKPGSGFGCSEYDLLIAGTSPAASLTTGMCPGDGSIGPCACLNVSGPGAGEGCLNSTGRGAKLTPFGSTSVQADDLGFRVEGAVPMQPALLVEGAVPTQIPFKDGMLCMGNPTQRLEILFLDLGGRGRTTVPVASSAGAQVGTTRYYQAWYRDPVPSPCGNGSNFTSGVQVFWI